MSKEISVSHCNSITPQNSPRVRKEVLRTHPAVLRAPESPAEIIARHMNYC